MNVTGGPIQRALYAAMLELERLPASPQQTKVSTMLSDVGRQAFAAESAGIPATCARGHVVTRTTYVGCFEPGCEHNPDFRYLFIQRQREALRAERDQLIEQLRAARAPRPSAVRRFFARITSHITDAAREGRVA